MKVWKWSQYAIVEAVEPFKPHPTSMSYIYKVFEHLKKLWMGIWQHTHTIATTEVCPDLGEFTEIQDDVSVETIPVRYRWGCRIFQTASHIYVIHIIGVWTPETAVDGNMAAHSYRCHHRGIPRIGRAAGWNPRWCQCGNDPSTLSLRLKNLSNCIPHPCHKYITCLNTLNSCVMKVWKWSHYAIVEAVEPFKLHPTSMSNIY